MVRSFCTALMYSVKFSSNLLRNVSALLILSTFLWHSITIWMLHFIVILRFIISFGISPRANWAEDDFHKVFASLLIILVPQTVASDGCLPEDRHLQTYVNCKSHRECGIITDARTLGSEDECRVLCVMGKSACEMASYEHKRSYCQMFSQNHCDSVEVETGFKVFRWACPSVCLEYSLSSHYRQRGTCETINGTGFSNHTRSSCLSLCLDTAECRGSTYWLETGICELHHCASMTDSNNETYFTSRICMEEPSSTKQQTSSTAISSFSQTLLLQLPTGIINTTPNVVPIEQTGTYIMNYHTTGILLATDNSISPKKKEQSDITPHRMTATKLTTLPTTISASGFSPYFSTDVNTYTNKYFGRSSDNFFTHPANLAAVSAAGGLVTTGMLTAAACKLAKKKTDVIPSA